MISNIWSIVATTSHKIMFTKLNLGTRPSSQRVSSHNRNIIGLDSSTVQAIAMSLVIMLIKDTLGRDVVPSCLFVSQPCRKYPRKILWGIASMRCDYGVYNKLRDSKYQQIHLRKLWTYSYLVNLDLTWENFLSSHYWCPARISGTPQKSACISVTRPHTCQWLSTSSAYFSVRSLFDRHIGHVRRAKC